MQQSPYAYILTIEGQPPAVFTWPNVAKKFIRDIYSTAEGELTLPPPGYLVLKRYKVNPRAGHAMVIDNLDVEKFLGIDDLAGELHET